MKEYKTIKGVCFNNVRPETNKGQTMKQNKIKEIVFNTCKNYELQYSFYGEQQLKTILKGYNIKDIE